MKEVLTTNMIKVLLKKYDFDGDRLIPYKMLLDDLQLLSNVNPAIRIFKTEAEVEFFLAEGGDTMAY